MIILIPACGGDDRFFSGYWPKNVTEINGKAMILCVLDNFANIPDTHYVTILKQQECAKFHTDDIVKIYLNNNVKNVYIENETKGALCTCLLGIDEIKEDEELIISNNDHIFDADLNEIIQKFRAKDVDCGIVTFECIHPRWSYAREEDEKVIEIAEKRPISKNAIAGIYYYKKGKDFIECAKSAISKGRSLEGNYYISETVNEMILRNKNVRLERISPKEYHTFYEPRQIEKYEMGDM